MIPVVSLNLIFHGSSTSRFSSLFLHNNNRNCKCSKRNTPEINFTRFVPVGYANFQIEYLGISLLYEARYFIFIFFHGSSTSRFSSLFLHNNNRNCKCSKRNTPEINLTRFVPVGYANFQIEYLGISLLYEARCRSSKVLLTSIQFSLKHQRTE